MTAQQTFAGWCCTDCLMILANGEGNPEWSESEAIAHLAAMAHHCHNQGVNVTLGLMASEHDTPCGSFDDPAGPFLGNDCDCEHDTFSSSSCDTCGSSLGGERYAVTFFCDGTE